MVHNMTEGNPIKLILAFTGPLLIGNVFQQFYNIADIIIVGRFIGVHALAAVGATAPLFMALLGLTIGMASGFTVIMGQRFGGGLRRRTPLIFHVPYALFRSDVPAHADCLALHALVPSAHEYFK